MAIGKQLTVDGTAVLVASAQGSPKEIIVHTGGTMYFGGDNTVTSSTGFRLDKDDKMTFTLIDGAFMYAIGSGTPATLYVWEATL